MKESEPTGLAGLSNDLAAAVEAAGQSVVAINARQRFQSSGVHWQPGVIVTAEHTVKRDEDIVITFPDGTTEPATLAGRDAGTDLAVLKFSGASLPVAERADLSTVRVGHLVLAVGRSSEDGIGAAMGVLSALSGPWRSWRGGQLDHFMQPDLTIYPGFSGGPLSDIHGKILGINTSGLSRMSLTVPAVTVDRVVKELLEKGRVARGYLGLGMHPVRLPDNLIESLKLESESGVMMLSVEPGGPSDRAGVLIGDVILAVGGKTVSDTEEVLAVLASTRVGDSLPVALLRGGARMEVTIQVGERPGREN